MTVEGRYENHHLLCPVHGRTVPHEALPGRASCGCQPRILWTVESHGEEDWTGRLDNLGVGLRFVHAAG